MEGGFLHLDPFRSLPKEEKNRLCQDCSISAFPKESRIFEEGKKADAVWFILSGWVRLVKRSPEGRPVTLFVVTTREPLFGVSAVGFDTYAASAIAATGAEVAKIPQRIFQHLLNTYPSFAKSIAVLSCKRIREMELTYAMAYDTVDRRIAHVLLQLSNDFGDTLFFTHREISEMAGTTVESSIRALSRFKRKGWVRSSRGKIVLLQPKELAKEER